MPDRDTSPAPIDILRAKIVKPNGVEINLKNADSTVTIFNELTIEEDIFKAGLEGTLLFEESSQIGEMLPLVGGEQLLLDVETPNVENSNKSLKLYVHGVTPLVDEVNDLMRGNIRTQQWLVEFGSYENVYSNYTVDTIFEDDSNNFVGKIAASDEDEDETGLVQYLAEKFFDPNDTGNSSEEMDIEPTSNSVWLKKNHMLYPFRKQVQQMSPINLMNYVSERAVPENNTNATNYLFWQDLDRWHFRSVNSIIRETETPKKYYVDFDRNLNLPDSFASFIVAKEYTPLEFMNGGAYLSTYERVSPDYEKPFLDFTSFYEGHKIEKIEYSYQEEKDDIERIEEFPLIDDDFEFEVSDSLKKYDTLHGYFDESHYNDPKIRLRHEQDEYARVFLSDKNHTEPNKSYNESLLWQPMFDQTNASVKTIKSIIEIKEELEENRARLAFKKDLKEKWSAYRCSVCCLRGLDDGITGGASSDYNVVSAGTFTDTVNYDPNNPNANENGFISSYPFDEEDSFYNITMGELYNLKQPEELTSTLFQIDATLYSLQRMQQSIEEQISYCSQYPVFANYWADIDFLETYFIRGNPEDEEEGGLYQRYQNFYFQQNITNGLHNGSYGWASAASPLGFEFEQSTPPQNNSSFHGIYQPQAGGVHLFPCVGCFSEPQTPASNSLLESTDEVEEGDSGLLEGSRVTRGVSVERDSRSLRHLGYSDISRADDCIVNWGPSAISVYARKQELVEAYKEVLLNSWQEFVNRRVFVQSKQPYLETPELETSFENVKSIKRKNIRGSRYEVFALKESLVDDVESSYEYFVSYADFAGGTSGTHPYYDQGVNTDIGSYNGLLNPNVLLSGIDPGDISYATENAFVMPTSFANQYSYDKTRNPIHVFVEGQPRFFALSGINNTTLNSIFDVENLSGLNANNNNFTGRDPTYLAAQLPSEQEQYEESVAGSGLVPLVQRYRINTDQPDFAYEDWASKPGVGGDLLGPGVSISDAAAFRSGVGRYYGRWGYSPFDVFFTPFMGNRNNVGGKRNDTAFGVKTLIDSAYRHNTPFDYYTGQTVLDQDRYFSQVEDYTDPMTFGGSSDQTQRTQLGANTMGDNVFDPMAFAKNLGMSSFGLSTNYGSHFYRDFGFPGELIVKITPTRASTMTTSPGEESGGGGTDPDIPDPDSPEPPEPEEISGCTDPTALNYNPNATVDDGSCSYPEGDPNEPIGSVNQFARLAADVDGGEAESTIYFNLDGQLTIEIIGISINGGRGGQLGYTDDYISGGNKSPLYRDDGYLEYNVGPQYTNACDALDCSDLLNDYVNRANWYTPRESFKSPRRFFAEVQSYIRVEFETPIGEDTLSEFPYGFIRDAGTEYYAPYLVQLTAGPFGRHSANYNMSVIGIDPFGFDVAVTRTDKWKDHLYESGTKPVLYPIKAVEAEAYDPINVFYRTVTEENQWAHVSFNNLPVPGERLPSSWHSFKAPMSGVSPDVLFEQHFQSSIWHDGDYQQFVNTNSYQGETKLSLLEQRAYQRYSWGGSGFVRNGFVSDFGMLWSYNEENFPPPEDVDVFSPEEYVWKFDISGESEYGVFTPPENATTLDDVKLDDYIHDLERNFSGQFVVFARRNKSSLCSRYECANPDGPVIAPPDTGEDDYDPYINCPMQELRPDVLDYERYLEEREDEESFIESLTNRYLRLLGILTEEDFKEPTAQEISELESQIDECSLIEEKLGDSYLGCIYSDPNASNSCNCPEQGENFAEYLEASRTYATFWDTPNEAPLRRDAQMMQLTTQKAIGVLPGDLSLRPGQIIEVVNPQPIDNKHPSKRSAGRWLIGSIKHNIRLGAHMMGITCFRDSTPQDPNDITDPIYTQE
tara:strand:+ start:5238 stop:10784 length:5547 start_codon:yes stop_codon:yes gene_type:complete